VLSATRAFLLGAVASQIIAAAVHPLEPLSTNELRAAVEILLSENRITTNTLLPIVTLQEPSKENVLGWQPGADLPREAFLTAYDLSKHETHEAVVDLGQRRVVAWRARPGVEPRQAGAEYDASAALLKTNEAWVAALNRRGITNLDLVDSGGIPGALIPFKGAGDVRLLRVSPFYARKGSPPLGTARRVVRSDRYVPSKGSGNQRS
jgi:Cu2+-containing amine oxidase